MDESEVRRARTAAAAIGWRVQKSRRQLHMNNLGMLMLVDDRNFVVDGSNYDCEPERIAYCCNRIRDTDYGQRQTAYGTALKEYAVRKETA